MFRWLRERRREKQLARPFPATWESILRQNVGHYPLLDNDEQDRLRRITRVMVLEKNWEGCGGLTITEEMQVTIAAQAAIPVLGIDHDYFSRVPTILVYPTAFHLAEPDETGDEEFVPSNSSAEGQAVYRGPVILSWDEVLTEGRDPGLGQNVVIHEFVHQLDFLDNTVDGVPLLESQRLRERWLAVMNHAMEHHRQLVKRGEETFFTEQAAQDRAEFFADASEAFFCIPLELVDEHEPIYQLLAEFYRLNPLAWFASGLDKLDGEDRT